MSSEIEGIGTVAGAVVLAAGGAAVAGVLGAGFLAWQAGTLLLSANASVNRRIDERNRRREAERQQLDALEEKRNKEREASAKARERKRAAAPERQEIREAERFLSQMRDACGLIAGAAQNADTLRVRDTDRELHAAYNEQLMRVSGRILAALESIEVLADECGLSEGLARWLTSCFEGIDKKIERLCDPQTSLRRMGDGLREMEKTVNDFELLFPGLEKDRRQFCALYAVYAEAAPKLGETVKAEEAFPNAGAVEAELRFLEARCARARQCADIYGKLGAEAYLCYAWDEELRALGYRIKPRRSVEELAAYLPEQGTNGTVRLPFYAWGEGDLTQFYSLSEECGMQLIVHEDGAVSLQTIAEGDGAEIRHTQKAHCDRMKALRARLKENWFVICDYEETAGADRLTGVMQWRTGEQNAWHRPEEAKKKAAAAKRKKKETPRAMRQQ